MLSVTSRTAGAANSYYIHLQKDGEAKEDYYAKEGVGQWHGTGAEKFGLSGEVGAGDFAKLSAGFDPTTGEKLVQNAGEADRVAGFDLTFSAPKSVSIAWAVADEKTSAAIEAAHDKAVKSALDLIQEKAAFSRTGKGGEEQVKANLATAVFRHGTSRELDPQIHSHAFVMNVAQREDGSTGTVDARHFYEWQKAAGATYRAEFAVELQKAGYVVERDGDAFRIANITTEQEKEFSTRRQQIEAALEKSGQSGAKAAEIAALSTRKSKEIREPDELKKEWGERADEVGLTRESAAPNQHTKPVEIIEKPTTETVIKDAHEMKSVVKESELYRAAAVASQGWGGKDSIMKLAEATKDEAITLTNDKGDVRYTSQDILAMEKQNVDIAQSRQNEQNGLADTSVSTALEKFATDKGFALSSEQQEAVKHLASDGGVKVLIGDAGTGKSTVMSATREAFEKEGYQVIGIAPTGKAAAGLQEGAGIQSQTIHSFIKQVESGETVLTNKSVIVMDEAGMIGSQKMNELQKIAQEAGAKIILTGDTKQLQAVEAGAPLRDIEREVGHARLQENFRQNEVWNKAAASEMSRGEAAEAMLKYADNGQVHIAQTYNKTIEQATNLAIKNIDAVGADKSIVLANTNKQVDDLNHKIREQLKSRGELQEGKEYTTTHGKTELAQGERVVLERNNKDLGVKNGDFGTITKQDKESVTVKLDRTGQEVKIDTKDYNHINHGYASTTHKAQGVTTEKAVVVGSQNTSREAAYVQSSRAKDTTDWVFSTETINKMADKQPPTEPMKAVAEKVEAARVARGENPALPENYQSSFRACRDYLNQHAYKIDERQKALSDPKLEQFKDTVRAMSQSKQNESTLDYKVMQKAPAPGLDKGLDKGGLER